MFFGMLRRSLRERLTGRRHVCVRFFVADITNAHAKYRATRLGGIPAGSLEVLGR
jgi:hypothetical protein